MNKTHALALATVLGVTALVTPTASAADWGFSVNINKPIFGATHDRHDHRDGHDYRRPRTVQQWVPGYYETRTEQVLVSPERHEKVWVEPIYRSERHRGHFHQVVVTPGYYRDICIPAQYQTVTRQVWVPGFYKEVVIHAEPRPFPRPHGGFVSIGYDRR